MDINYFGQDPINHANTLDKAFGNASDHAQQPVFVDDYFRHDGTHVHGHMRSHPDGNPFNNYTYPGNINPFTGEIATGDPLTYLDHHYHHSFQHVIEQSNPLAHVQQYSMPPLSFQGS
ncbi:hypothetical protein PCCS19_36310 [Paenibacillus sp. CCS19]|uniref:hypothetical protein n=1 Tax=Paenibacillus sp. CCS19 TaxID=3158387 RepID=UPI00256107E0|nr:hypothetical protein [Paenibacillus cellulosilyticus]GMK40575.1 hypothetical protein PCCS19_36310 [Paenibacillus cellulosilyticus]